MSLMVWLPLNGDLTQQGLSNVTVTNNGATVDNNGKIGKCYSFNGNGNYIRINPLTLTQNWSICFWANISRGMVFTAHTAAFNWLNFWHYNGHYYLNTGDSYNNPFIDANGTAIAALPNTWHYFTLVFEQNVKAKLYIDGQYSASATTYRNVSISNAEINLAGYYRDSNGYDMSGKLNDIRIYDHALSAKEVKELAKGLVLHYRLAGPGQENLILESHKVTASGAASGITRSYESDGSLKIISTSGNGNYCSIGFGKDSNPNVGSKMAVGDKYTISLDIKVESGTKLPTLFINGGNSYKQLLGTIVPRKWIRAYYTSTWATPGTNYGNISLHLGFSGAIGTYYIKNFKLEKSNIPTPWCPAPGDSLYSAMGYDNNIEYDCSGYLRNGTKSGTITWDVDSPRYTTSYKFNGSSCIKNNQFYFNSNIWTVSLWYKRNTAPTDWETIICLSKNDGSDSNKKIGIMLNSNRIWFKAEDNSMSMSSLKIGEWCHLAIVSNGTSATIYENGIQKGTTTMSSSVTGAYDLVIGARAASAGASTTSYYNKGNISDVRIYTTALSAEDIAELYHSAVIVDNTGKNYAYEYFEAN